MSNQFVSDVERLELEVKALREANLRKDDHAEKEMEKALETQRCMHFKAMFRKDQEHKNDVERKEVMLSALKTENGRLQRQVVMMPRTPLPPLPSFCMPLTLTRVYPPPPPLMFLYL